MGEIAECAARTKGAAFCWATVNLRVGPEAREKRRQAARSPKAGTTPDATILLIHWTHFESRPRSPAVHLRDWTPSAMQASSQPMRALLVLVLLVTANVRAHIHPSLPEPGTLDGLGVNIHFTEPQPGELEMIRAAGFRWVRMDFTWAATEPEPGRCDFSKYDSLVAALEKAGLRAYFILDSGHPKYARPAAPGAAGDTHPFTSRAGTQEFRDAFEKWAVAAVGHFKGRGIVWELWNEPNIAGFWKPKPDVQQYIALAKTASAALEKAGLRSASRTFPPGLKHAAACECLAGPATRVVALPFLGACFGAGLLDVFDAISVHPYRQGAPESVADSTCFFPPS